MISCPFSDCRSSSGYVGHRDRAREPAVRRPGDGVPLRLLHRQAEGGHQRLSSLSIGEHHERCVGPFESSRGLQRPRENLVEVDRARELPEDATPASLLLGALEGAGQFARELVHPRVQALHYLGDALVRLPVRAPANDQQSQEEHYESA